MGIPGRRPDLLTPRLEASHREMPDPATAGGTIVELERPDVLTDDAVVVWEQVVPDLVAAKVLREQDLVLLIEFCEQVGMARRARERLVAMQVELDRAMEDGPQPGEEPKDYIARVDAWSQAVKRERSSYVALMRLAYSAASEFGISPVARVRLGLFKVQGASLLDALSKAREGSQ